MPSIDERGQLELLAEILGQDLEDRTGLAELWQRLEGLAEPWLRLARVGLQALEVSEPPAPAVWRELRQLNGDFPGAEGKLLHYLEQRDRRTAQSGTDVESTSDEARYPLTDAGNGQRFADMWGDRVRWVENEFKVYTGKAWTSDRTLQVERLALATIRSIYEDAAQESDPDRRKALASWACKSESDFRQRAMIRQARKLLAITSEELDRDPLLLNCDNGTIDLRTGELRAHDPANLITRLVRVPYDPDAPAPWWIAFLLQIFGGCQATIDFMQRWIGYLLTGLVVEQVMVLLIGTSGTNGKTTLLERLLNLLGDYASQTQAATLMFRDTEKVPEDIADLQGVRLVTCVEPEEGQRLAEARIKMMTGGDTLRVRHLYSRWFSFRPQFKIMLATNYRPQIRGQSNAIWRRLIVVPFEVEIPEEKIDKHLGEKLDQELPGILAWAVQGCLAWQREGLKPPQDLLTAKASYRSEMDVLAAFLEECIVVHEGAQATAADLYETYSGWCTENGEKPASKRGFGLQLKARGFQQGRTGSTRFWIGVGLAAEPQQQPLDRGAVTDDV